MYHQSVIKKKNAVPILGLHEGWKTHSGGGSLKIHEGRLPQTFFVTLGVLIVFDSDHKLDKS